MESKEAKGQKVKSEVYREQYMMVGENADEPTKIYDTQFNADEAIGEGKGYDIGKICPEYKTSSDESENSQIIISQIVEYILEGVCGHGTKVLDDENTVQGESLGKAADIKKNHKTRDTPGGEHENRMANMEKSSEEHILSKNTAESQNTNYEWKRESERAYGICSLVPKTQDSPWLDKCTDRKDSHGTAGKIGDNGANIFGHLILESSSASNETTCDHKRNETIKENDMESKGFNNGIIEDRKGGADKESIYAGEPKKTTNDFVDQTFSNGKDRLSKVLNILNLTDKYPGGLTCSDMYRITKSSLFDEQPKCHKDLASYFLQEIAKYNYTAREFHITESHEHRSSSVQTGKKSKFRQKMEKCVEENAMEVSPMDVIIAVFLCCDDVCKQDLVSHMWSCRLAVPLIIQEKVLPSQPSCYLWPLRSLVMRWETEVNEEHRVREGRLVQEAVTSIAFIRFGEVGLSKSALINSVISASEKTHSIFMNRDSPGSTKYRHLVDGLIDIGWYFPTPKIEARHNDCFQDAVMFLNLHGDAFVLQNQLELLSKVAGTITVLCKVADLHRFRHILKAYVDRGKTLLIMLADQNIDTEDENVIDDDMDYLEADDNQLEFVEVRDKKKAELVRETRSKLRELSKGKYVLENVLSRDVPVSIDEKTKDLLEAKEEAQVVYNIVRTTPYQDRKKLHLPLQGDPWIRWAKADKERLKVNNKGRNENFQAYMTERDNIMKECRLLQIESLRQNVENTILCFFINAIATENDRKRAVFLRWLKIEFDDLSRKELQPVYQRYEEIMKIIATVGDDDIGSLKKELEELDQKVSLLSFGLEHLLREMGQLYEATMQLDISENPFAKYNLPCLAAKIVLNGYPFELLDGHVNSVPLNWVKEVLKSVQDILALKSNTNKVRTKVISTLGIQSSGKSTMLNALFGCQYAVSAGRCTRGVYCQFIEVDEMYRTELGTDFVLAIDTEGLRAPELSAINAMIKHDNELSTFVIGLADLTILNLMGENTTYLDELLPISVQAFLRMEMASDFKPKCVIVHQNVSKEDKQKLIQQGKMLVEKLNKMTELACKMERTEIKPFKKVIEFDVSRDVFYLTALLDGIQPMAPISTRYSEELTILKRTLLSKVDERTPKSLDAFIHHLQTLWMAIKRDDFVYQFRNTIETEARTKLDDYWCEANWKFRQPVHILLSTAYVQTQNCKHTEELGSLKMTLELQIKREIGLEYQKQKSAFEAFIEEADTIMKETMTKWSDDMDKRFDDLRADLERETSIKLTDFEQDKRRELALRNEKIRYKDNLKAEMEQFLSDVESSTYKPVSEDGISGLFEVNWRKWKSHVLNKTPRPQANINIENDAYAAILRAFPNGTGALSKYLEIKSIECYDTCDFDVDEVLSHLNHLGHILRLSNKKDLALDLARTLFEQVDIKLQSRGRSIRPYTQDDIDAIVIFTQQLFQSKRKQISLKPKYEVYLAVIICGHSIKALRRFHEEYENQNSPETFLEKEKTHYLRIFQASYNKVETLSLLAAECREIIKNGMLEKITRTLPNSILVDMNCASFIMKSLAIRDILLNTAANGTFEDFSQFIHRPDKCISHYISKRVDDYADQKDKPLQSTFNAVLLAISNEVNLALHKSFHDEKDNFQTWLNNFQTGAKGVIVLENIDRLQELGKGKRIDMNLYLEKVKAGLERTVTEIREDMTSYLSEHLESFKEQIVVKVMETIIGCTESCPFCGAICVIAHAAHKGDHYTTLHRPQGCKRWHVEKTKVLSTDTCPVLVASPEATFRYWKDEKPMVCLYKNYRTVYPDWNITMDVTGEETSFWNWFFAEYVEQIAGDELIVPDIPLSWKQLDRKTEIKKLRDKRN